MKKHKSNIQSIIFYKPSYVRFPYFTSTGGSKVVKKIIIKLSSEDSAEVASNKIKEKLSKVD